MTISTPKNQLRILTAAAALLAAVGLSACSVAAVPQETSSAKTESTPSDNTQEETVTPEESSSDADTGPRAEYSASVTRTEDCASGAVTVNDPGNVVQINGSCATVSVSGNGTVVLADDIDSLKVNGTGSVVIAKKLGSVEATGTGNVVSWESGTPAVTDNGMGNVLAPVN